MSIPMMTFKDAIDHIRDTEFGIAQDGQLTVLKGVVRDAYTDLMSKAKWTFGKMEYSISLNAYYDTGTVVYDHTGGANELMVTITTGTWPSWAASGRLRIGTATYEINQRISDTIITLDSVMNPGEDVASTSDWTLYQTAYDLPDDFGSFAGFITGSDYSSGCYMEPDDWLVQDRVARASGEPFHWTILPSTEAGSESKFAVRVSGYPTSATTISFLYQQQPTDPVWAGVESVAVVGTIATNGTVTVTGTTTGFVSSMNGAVLRVGDATNVPTGHNGLYPFAEERRIRTVASTTSLTTTVAMTNTASGVKYIISSLIALPQVARLAFKAGLEYYMACRQKDAGIMFNKQRLYDRAILDAMAAESRHTGTKVANRPAPLNPWEPYPQPYIRSSFE